MDLNKLDKVYSEYEHYRRKILGNLTMASKIELKLWEEWKIENGYEKKPASKKNTAKG